MLLIDRGYAAFVVRLELLGAPSQFTQSVPFSRLSLVLLPERSGKMKKHLEVEVESSKAARVAERVSGFHQS